MLLCIVKKQCFIKSILCHVKRNSCFDDDEDKKTAKKYVIAKMFQDVNGASCGPNANNFKHPEVLEIGVPFSHLQRNTETHSLDNAFYTTYFYTKKRLAWD